MGNPRSTSERTGLKGSEGPEVDLRYVCGVIGNTPAKARDCGFESRQTH